MTQAEVQAYLQETQALERDYLAELLQSRRLAWRISLGAISLALMALIAIMGLTPLKQVIPLVLRVDNATGHVDLITTVRQIEHSYGEVVDTYFINQYVINRETYEYSTLQTLYDTTALLSSPELQTDYYALFTGSEARHKLWGADVKVTTHVQSIVPDTAEHRAVVRFSTQKYHRQSGREPRQYWIVHLTYHYIDATMAVKDRRLNPLGFQVTSYRRDPETLNPEGNPS